MSSFLCGLSVPKLSVVINTKTNEVDLRSADGHSSLPSVCVQYEPNGRCQVGGPPSSVASSAPLL